MFTDVAAAPEGLGAVTSGAGWGRELLFLIMSLSVLLAFFKPCNFFLIKKKIRTTLPKIFLLIAAFTLQFQDKRVLWGGQERNLRRSQSHTSKHRTTSKQGREHLVGLEWASFPFRGSGQVRLPRSARRCWCRGSPRLPPGLGRPPLSLYSLFRFHENVN